MHDMYPWLQPMWAKWQALSETERVSGALLCSAPQGSGVNQLVKLFVHTLVCSHSNSEPCGFCHSCELAQSGNHPDIHWVTAEKEGKPITVEQIRRCNQWAIESSQLGGKRVIVIHPAETMNESASNALLKTLESPAEDCVFILIANNNRNLLPTITSRCQKWSLAEPTLESTFQWLLTQTDKVCNPVGIRLCNGAPLKALEFFEQDKYSDFQKIELALTTFLSTKTVDYRAVWLTIQANPIESLKWIAVLMSDIQKVHFGLSGKEPASQGLSSQPPVFCEQSEALSQLIPYNVAYQAMLSINATRDQIERASGLNAELLFIRWLVELQEAICS
ncbi:DNA polymerase III subunit delta' [Vibrio sp. TH_r3]|uniref:DNA polymerase III subunit delta' n=1 Tax=Vibrio sp. TH_r3 TaxID=3082084 RepID=UPI0029537373|nr:DNA polymerase III subunit delta' [Vibrio sp. TH_r3]MDV7103948.1 DNA polymerase III subunit delta' [Vibrio sp. TH_r3]